MADTTSKRNRSPSEETWLRFFALMSNAITRREGTSLVPGTPTNSEKLVTEIRQLANELDVENRLDSYRRLLNVARNPVIKDARLRYFLLVINPTSRKVRMSIMTYTLEEFQVATRQYLEAENSVREQGGDAVLVSVDSITALRRAYPNYFFDTRRFLSEMRLILGQP